MSRCRVIQTSPLNFHAVTSTQPGDKFVVIRTALQLLNKGHLFPHSIIFYGTGVIFATVDSKWTPSLLSNTTI
ncbi:hypothetical protein FA15DRAFT_675861 [Coprinopsis marcescibilis]|uniref:Uncharacterized protein n=1 Tax=Coprinopsis marcescibilis TaxID=230819 RepID=A0A5C3KCQ0_COPMA|nr:hypothetical protein FA15DRAFT_675861 [Coprinopsis marcescibilis]